MVVVVVADRCRWSARHAVSRLDALAVCRRCTRRLSSRPHHTHRPTDGRSLVGSFSLVQEHSLCQRPLATLKKTRSSLQPASCPLLVAANPSSHRLVGSVGSAGRPSQPLPEPSPTRRFLDLAAHCRACTPTLHTSQASSRATPRQAPPPTSTDQSRARLFLARRAPPPPPPSHVCPSRRTTTCQLLFSHAARTHPAGRANQLNR